MADINIYDLTYSKTDIDAKVDYEAARLDAAVALKLDKSSLSAPSGVAALSPDGKHKIEEYRFSSALQSDDISNNATIITPEKLHYQIDKLTISKDKIGVAGGVVPLGGSLVIDDIYLPAVRSVHTFVVPLLVDMYNLPIVETVAEGDRCIVTDETLSINNGEYVAMVDVPLQSEWKQLPNLSSVASVNGATGAVVITSILESQENSEAILLLQTRTTGVETAISGSIQDQLDAHTSLIGINTTNISSNDTDILNLQTEQTTQNNRLQALETTIKAYSSYSLTSAVQLTNTFQKITAFTENITALNIAQSNGTVTVGASGVYVLSLEKIYRNEDVSPSEPIRIYTDIRKNGVSIYSRDVLISAATANDEPAVMSCTTPMMFNLAQGDYFEMFVRAEEGANSPTDTYLAKIESTIYKIA